MSAPIQMYRLQLSRRARVRLAGRVAARVVMGALCLCVAVAVFGLAYTNLPR